MAAAAVVVVSAAAAAQLNIESRKASSNTMSCLGKVRGKTVEEELMCELTGLPCYGNQRLHQTDRLF